MSLLLLLFGGDWETGRSVITLIGLKTSAEMRTWEFWVSVAQIFFGILGCYAIPNMRLPRRDVRRVVEEKVGVEAARAPFGVAFETVRGQPEASGWLQRVRE